MTYDALLKHFGGASAAAKALNVSRQAVYLWEEAGIPLDRQISIEEVTAGALRADLSPKLRRLLAQKVAA